MKKIYIIYFSSICLLISCGQSKEEKELEKVKQELSQVRSEIAQKEKDDREKALELEKQEKEKLHQQKINVGKKKKITQLQDILQKTQSSLTKEKLKLSEIEEFQIGRSPQTKAEQIRSSNQNIYRLERYISNIKNEIAELELNKTFDFQKTPKSLLLYVFESAKNDDFSNFQYLCDPYAENDADVNSICYYDLMFQEDKDEIKEALMNGRIMGDTKIDGNIAEIEFAFGRSSNKLETMKFINRNNYWYFYSM